MQSKSRNRVLFAGSCKYNQTLWVLIEYGFGDLHAIDLVQKYIQKYKVINIGIECI